METGRFSGSEIGGRPGAMQLKMQLKESRASCGRCESSAECKPRSQSLDIRVGPSSPTTESLVRGKHHLVPRKRGTQFEMHDFPAVPAGLLSDGP